MLEKEKKKIINIVYNFILFLIKKIGVYAVLKKIIYFLKYKNISYKIYVKNKDIIHFLNREKLFLKNILNNNLQ